MKCCVGCYKYVMNHRHYSGPPAPYAPINALPLPLCPRYWPHRLPRVQLSAAATAENHCCLLPPSPAQPATQMLQHTSNPTASSVLSKVGLSNAAWGRWTLLVSCHELEHNVFVEAMLGGRTLVVSSLELSRHVLAEFLVGNIVKLYVSGIHCLAVGCLTAKAEN